LLDTPKMRKRTNSVCDEVTPEHGALSSNSTTPEQRSEATGTPQAAGTGGCGHGSHATKWLPKWLGCVPRLIVMSLDS